MFKKVATYTDYNGVERTETFYFNLTQAEVLEMELSTTGGLSAMIQGVIDAKDTPQLIKIFKDLVLKSYGEKSADGRRFIKTPELTEAFAQTEAYSDIFMELATDDKAAAAFVQGITPKGLDKYAGSQPVLNEVK
jgi:hypothetical protein